VWIEVRAEHATELFTGFGRKGVSAEIVAEEACGDLIAWRDRDVPVGEHLADQLLVFLALAGGGAFRTGPASPHATTNADIIGRFLDRRFAFREDRGQVRVEVG
jgi:RNA 3'-terminal phosphate cyclase (ATP)